MNSTNEKSEIPFIGDILRENFNIPDSILDAYYGLVPQPDTENKIPEGYAGKLNRFNSPFRVNIYGAYPLMTFWEVLEFKMRDPSFRDYKQEFVFEYLVEYSKGFKKGYADFVPEIIEKHLIVKSDDAIVRRIMNYGSSPHTSRGEFTERYGGDRHIFSGWFEDGIKAGYFYRAWILILTNHWLFEPMFEKVSAIKESVPPETLDTIVKEKSDLKECVPPENLEQMVKDKEVLINLVEVLKPKGFVNSVGHWKGTPTELAALSEVCNFLIKKGITKVKVYKAWRDYFNIQFTDTVFKKPIKTDHLKKFEFIKLEFEKQ